jgi:hypothetical protein
MKPSNLTDYVYICLANGEWWTFWQLQKVIKEKTNKFYGEPTISAAIRNIRKDEYRTRYNIESSVKDPIERKSIPFSKGNRYRLSYKQGETNE